MRLKKFTQRTFDKWYAHSYKSFDTAIFHKDWDYAGIYASKRLHIKKYKHSMHFPKWVEHRMFKLERMLRRISY